MRYFLKRFREFDKFLCLRVNKHFFRYKYLVYYNFDQLRLSRKHMRYRSIICKKGVCMKIALSCYFDHSQFIWMSIGLSVHYIINNSIKSVVWIKVQMYWISCQETREKKLATNWDILLPRCLKIRERHVVWRRAFKWKKILFVAKFIMMSDKRLCYHSFMWLFGLWYSHTARKRERDQYTERDWHNRKQ